VSYLTILANGALVYSKVKGYAFGSQYMQPVCRCMLPLAGKACNDHYNYSYVECHLCMQAGQKSSGSAMVIDSDSAPEDSDFSADEDSSDDGDDSDDSDVVLCAEYRPHVQARELGDKWEEEAKESKAAQGRPPHSSLGLHVMSMMCIPETSSNC
jgi:hypothetical protein